MKHYFAALVMFVAGISVGAYLSRPTMAHAQGTNVTVTPVRGTWVGSHKPESLSVPGAVIGFGCGKDGCYILSR
jgi:hypothetical protein